MKVLTRYYIINHEKVDIAIFSPLYNLGLLSNEIKNVLSEVKLGFTTVVPTPTKLQTR